MPRVCYTQAVNSGKHREINQHPRKNGTNQNLPTPTVKAIKFEKTFLSFLPCRGHKRISGRQTTAANRPNQTDFSCFRFQFFFPFIVSFLSFQLNVSFPFIASFLSFRLFLSMRYFCPFVPCLIFRSLLLPIRFNSSCRFNSSFPFIASFLSFHLFPTMRYFRPLVSSLISCSFLLPFRFNSSLPFAPSFLLI